MALNRVTGPYTHLPELPPASMANFRVFMATVYWPNLNRHINKLKDPKSRHRSFVNIAPGKYHYKDYLDS